MKVAFRRAPIVGEENDESVLILLRFPKGLEEPSDRLVHFIDHGGIDLHAVRLPLGILGFGPWVGAFILWERGVLGNETDFFEATKALLAKNFPSRVVDAFVFADGFFARMKGVVRCCEGEVKKEEGGERWSR